jgi:hypothetical protein
MNWLRRLFLGSLSDDTPLDHFPIGESDPRPAKLATARERFGRPFLLDTPVARKTPASQALREIEAKVLQFRRKA